MNSYSWSVVNVTRVMPSPCVKFKFALQSMGLDQHRRIYVVLCRKHVVMFLYCFRTECRRAWSFSTPFVTTSGSLTPPSSCSSIRKICLKRKSRSLPSQYVFQSTEVRFLNFYITYLYVFRVLVTHKYPPLSPKILIYSGCQKHFADLLVI